MVSVVTSVMAVVSLFFFCRNLLQSPRIKQSDCTVFVVGDDAMRQRGIPQRLFAA
jgi:hypothetical protein